MRSVITDTTVEEVDPRQRRPIATTLAVLAVIAVVVVALTRGSAEGPSFSAEGPAQPLPAGGVLETAELAEFEGMLVGLRGTPVIVNIWASWCAPCRTETALLERTWRAHGEEVVFIGVASRDAFGAAEDFMDDFDVTYANVFDRSGDIRKALGLRGFPTTYVFDREGRLRMTIVGGVSEQRLAAILADLER